MQLKQLSAALLLATISCTQPGEQTATPAAETPTKTPPEPARPPVRGQPSGEINETRALTIEFAAEIARETEVNQAIEDRDLLELKPKIPGIYRWTDRRTLTFAPKDTYQQSTRYQVTVKRELLGPRAPAFEPYSFEFNTPMFRLLSVQPFFEAKERLHVRVNVELSHPVRLRDARAAISFLDDRGRLLDARLASEQDGRVIAFELAPLPLSLEERNLKVRIAKTLTAIGGGEPLGENILRDLSVDRAAELEVESLRVSDEDGAFLMTLTFDSKVQADAFQRALVITPKTKIRIREDYRSFNIQGEFAAGQKYRIRVKRGLRSTEGALMASDFEDEVVMADLAPSLRFSSRGAYLLRSGQRNVGVESVNVQNVEVRIGKVFDNNLVHMLSRIHLDPPPPPIITCDEENEDYQSCENYEDEEYDDGEEQASPSRLEFATFGRWLHQAAVTVRAKMNEVKTTPLSFDDIDREKRPGLYRLEVSDKLRPWLRDHKWLIKTDLAITAKKGPSQIWVRVHSLESTNAVAGAEVSLLTSTNEVLDTIRTDEFGIAVFEKPSEKPGDKIVLVSAKKGDDYSFLSFAETALPVADFDIGGEDGSALPYLAYLYGDRGIYRPGDTIHLTALIRSRNLRAPPEFPLVVELYDPAMRIVQTLRGTTKNDGVETFDVAVPPDATTGRYRFRALASSLEIGRLEFLVEEFMPDRIKVEVAPEHAEMDVQNPAKFTVAASYLFGAKAVGLPLESKCSWEEVDLGKINPPGFAFAVTDPFKEEPSAVSSRRELDNTVLDDHGKAELTCESDDLGEPRGPVRVHLSATVSENGGRSVTTSNAAILHSREYYIGARRSTAAAWIKEGEDAGLEAYVIDRAMKGRAGVKLKGTISEVEWRSILKLVGQRYAYVSTRSEKVVHTFQLTSNGAPQKIPFKPALPGLYRLKLTADSNETSLTFFAGGTGQSAWNMRRPDHVALSTDKDRYQLGETAEVLVRAPYAGRLFVTLEREKVLWSKTFELEGTTGTISIPMIEAALPNVYLVAQLIRAPDSKEKMAPERAFAVLPVQVDSDRHRLSVELTTPESMRPNHPLEVTVKIGGAEKRARVTIAAVDEGILQITNFTSPDAFGHFFKKRRLALATHDIFSLLLPELEGVAAQLNEGGGGDSEVKRKHYNPISVKRVKPVALWSGLLIAGPDGTAKVHLDVPDLDGSLRVMAVAFAGDKFGAASKNVIVRDPIILLPTLPRFVAPLDRFRMPVEVFNATDGSATIAVNVEINGRIKVLGKAKRTVKLARGERGGLIFDLAADEVAGKAKVVITAAANNILVKNTTDLAIRPVNTTSTEVITASAQEGEPAKLRLPGGFMEGSVRARINIGPTPTSQLGASLQYLLEYPHGCVEQTTSRSFPLLYVEDLARSEGTVLKDKADVYVAAGVARLFSMQMADGGLSYWPGGNYGYAWTSVYAAHFLVEAKKAGFQVEPQSLARLLKHLESIAGGAHPHEGASDQTSRMYALYVLALAGKAPTHELLDAATRTAPANMESRALLGAALVLAGERARGEKFLGTDFSIPKENVRDGLRSTMRELAIVLSMLADISPGHSSVPLLIDAIMERAHAGRWHNTQENAYALMALGKIHKKLGTGSDGRGSFSIDGKVVKTFDQKKPFSIESEGAEWVGRELKVSIDGPGTVWIGATVEGIKAVVPPARSKSIEVSRDLLDLDGNPVNDEVHQGDLLVIRHVITNQSNEQINYVAVVDLLPAGLEIENPRLANAVSGLDWLENSEAPEHLDVRDDRAIFYTSLPPHTARTFYYGARAVTEGTFVVPHLFAEAMYDPTKHGFAGAGKLKVVERAP